MKVSNCVPIPRTTHALGGSKVTYLRNNQVTCVVFRILTKTKSRLTFNNGILIIWQNDCNKSEFETAPNVPRTETEI